MTKTTPSHSAEASKLKAIYQARKKADPNLTQEAIAERAGWAGQSVVSQYLNGRIPLNLTALMKFANILGFAPREVSPRLADEVLGSLQFEKPDAQPSETDHRGMDIYEIRIQRLREIIGDRQLNDFANAFDLDASYLSQLLNGHRPLGERAALNIESKLGLAPGELGRQQAEATARQFSASDIRRANLALILRARFDNNKSALGRVVGRQAGYVAGMLPDSKNARSFEEANARDFEQKLGLPTGWLDQPHVATSTEHANVTPALQPHRDAREYPVISWVAAGSWSEACEIHQPGIADRWLASNENAGSCGYWLEVVGDSMAPPTGFGFASGLFILVQPEGFDLVSGKYYIAKLIDTGETTFKQYVRDAGVEYLRPLNPAFRTMEITDNVQIIGRVIDARPPRSVF